MPIIDLNPVPVGMPHGAPDKAMVTPSAFTPGESDIKDQSGFDTGIFGVLGAAFRTENTIVSTLSSTNRGLQDVPDGIDPWSEIKGTKYEPHFKSFVDVRNRRQFDNIRNDIDRETQDRKTIAAAPWWMSVPSSLLANVADPTFFIPGGAFVRGVKGGFSVAKTGASVAAGAVTQAAVQETVLHGTQQLRTIEESAINIGAAAVLGGLLGVGGASLLGREWGASVKAIERGLDEIPQPPEMVGAHPLSIGAAAVTAAPLEVTEIAGRVAGATVAATRRLNPGLRIVTSESTEARNIGANLFEMSQYIRGNEDGLVSPIAVETLRKEWNAGLMTAIEDSNATYQGYRKNGGLLSRTEFNEEVGRAMRRGDASAVPEVADIAKSWRRNVFDPLKQAAIEAKLLPADVSVDTAVSYFSRIWNRKRLISEEPQFKQVVRNWVTGNFDTWRASFDAETRMGAAKLKDKPLSEYLARRAAERDARFGSPNDTANDVSNEVFNALVGRTSEGVRPEFITVKARGPLKERTFNIPDELVERWLESDIDQVARRYSRIMSADVELARKFGSPDMADALAKVRSEYDQLREGVTDAKRLQALSKQERSDLEDLRGVRDIIRGTFAQSAWERDFGAIVRVANAVQYILKMGQVVLSSLTEPVRVVAAKGLLPFMQDGFSALSNLPALKLSVQEARLAGNINDKILSARLSTMADLTDFYGSRGPVEKFLDNATNVASSWNGIRLWTDGVKMLAGTMIQNKMLRATSDFAKASPADKRYLAFLGIDESMAERIAKQFAEHGQNVNGVHVAGTAEWTDEVARRTYRSALNKDLDSMVVTRGAADLPLFANTPLGKLIFQFNSFNLASHQRILLRGLQEGHARFLSSVVALSSMGMLQTYLTAFATNSVNKLPNINENPGWWIAEGLDKSGIFMIPMQVANGVEKLTGVNPIKAPIKANDVGNAISQRNRNRNELGLFGPSAGTLQDVGSVAAMVKNTVTGEDITQAQKNAAERLIPFNSYFGIRQMMKYFVNPPQD